MHQYSARQVIRILLPGFLVFIFILSSTSYAQQSKIDSLYAVLKTEKEDTNKVKTLNILSRRLFLISSYKVADTMSRHALKLAETIGYKSGMTTAYSLLGLIYNDESNYSEAIKNLDSSLAISEEIGSVKGKAGAYSMLGSTYYYQGNYSAALKNELLSLKLTEQIKDSADEGTAYIWVGCIYYALNNPNEALKNHLKGLEIFKRNGDIYGLGYAYQDIALVLSSEGKYDSALVNHAKALEMYKKTGNRLGMVDTYVNMGSLYEIMHLFPQAIENYLQSLKIAREIGAQDGIVSAFNNIGSLQTKEKQYKLAKQYLDSALFFARKIGRKDEIYAAYVLRTRLDSATLDYKAAFNQFRSAIVYKDSMENEANTKKMVQEQMQYEFDKEQAGEKAEQDKKDAQAAAERKKQGIITASVSIGLALVLVFSGLLFSRFRITQKQKQVIEDQKKVVEERNKEVLASITYAKRLQDAILPPISTIKKYLPESFVLYKPKDIVAGDFYWMEFIPTPSLPSGGEGKNSLSTFSPRVGRIQEGMVFLAACDCTGHGVPGAMVSVVCSNALNRAVKEFKLRDTGKILDKVRELVLETFEKSEGEVKDGMDISLASITPLTQGEGQGMRLQWSGAYNSLWCIQNGEFKEIVGDKQPIGKHDNPTPFTLYTIAVNNGDSLFLFTDGYADQFGGPKGKKFKYKQMQELLAANSNKPMEEQGRLLNEALENWKGSLEQVDDVLVIGIRV